jgi:extracellular elastinolytic metalloproteinase
MLVIFHIACLDILTCIHLQPRRDSDLQNDFAMHEFTHGLSNRMTGGGTARCLQTTEAKGMGEGWSDAVAE